MQYQAEVFQFTSQMEFIKYIPSKPITLANSSGLWYIRNCLGCIYEKKNQIAVFILLKYMYFLKPDQGTVKCYP